jgi:hypothetical protein
MKSFYVFLISILSIVSLTSCATAAYAQGDGDEVYATSAVVEVDPNIVITYGMPILDEGSLVLYYVYRGIYYYPYWFNNGYYFHAYRHRLPINHYRKWYKPVPRDFHRHFSGKGIHVRRGNRFDNRRNHIQGRPMPSHNRGVGGMRPNINNGPSHGMNRGGSMHSGPMNHQQRSSTRMGGRR